MGPSRLAQGVEGGARGVLALAKVDTVRGLLESAGFVLEEVMKEARFSLQDTECSEHCKTVGFQGQKLSQV